MALSLRDLTLIAGGLAVLAWATWPPDRVAFNDACQPLGGPATMSAALYGNGFWRSQLEAATVERNLLLTQPGRRSRIDAEAKRQMQDASPLEGRMMRLSQAEGRVDDALERERQEAAQQSARLRRIAVLMACEAEISQRLGE